MGTCSIYVGRLFLFFVYWFFFFKQKTAYEMRISDWSSDVCSSDLVERDPRAVLQRRDLLLADRRRIARRLLRQPPSRNQGDDQEGRDERQRPGDRKRVV